MKSVSLYLVEDDPLVSELLQEFLKGMPPFRLIGEARDGATAVKAILRLRPDVLILDLRLPEMHGLDVLQILHECLPTCKVIIFTGSLSESILRRALRLGAVAFVEKAYGLRELRLALEAAVKGETYFSPSIARIVEQYPT